MVCFRGGADLLRRPLAFHHPAELPANLRDDLQERVVGLDGFGGKELHDAGDVRSAENRKPEAGVQTEVHQYSGAFHLAHAFPGTAIGARMLADRHAAIRRLLQ